MKEETKEYAKLLISMSTDYLMGGITEETYLSNLWYTRIALRQMRVMANPLWCSANDDVHGEGDKRLGNMRLQWGDIAAFRALTMYHPAECVCWGCGRGREYEKINRTD